MERVDKNGRWSVEGSVSILIEPSDAWKQAHQVNAKEVARQAILRELSELDKFVPRVVEDIIAQGGFTVSPSNILVINKKTLLREELKKL